MTSEVSAADVRVGDTVIAKRGDRRYKVTDVSLGALAPCPYWKLTDQDGSEVEHDTSFDSRNATYTVER